MIAEYCFASLFSELHTQLKTTQLLLDKATNGFCTLDLDMQTITSASPHLSDTLGCTGLVGRRLTDFVVASDRCRVTFSISDVQTSEADLSPVLVTCSRRASDEPRTQVFDAQLHPFALIGRQLHIFLQVAGEFRRATKDSHPGGREGDNLTARLDPISEASSELDNMWESVSYVPLQGGTVSPSLAYSASSAEDQRMSLVSWPVTTRSLEPAACLATECGEKQRRQVCDRAVQTEGESMQVSAMSTVRCAL